jgi:hypothetical protein
VFDNCTYYVSHFDHIPIDSKARTVEKGSSSFYILNSIYAFGRNDMLKGLRFFSWVWVFPVCIIRLSFHFLMPVSRRMSSTGQQKVQRLESDTRTGCWGVLAFLESLKRVIPWVGLLCKNRMVAGVR